jgi:hypothetical protein
LGLFLWKKNTSSFSEEKEAKRLLNSCGVAAEPGAMIDRGAGVA